MKARLIASMSLGLAAAAIAVMPSAANAQVAATNYNYVGAGVGAGGLGGGSGDIGLSVNSKFTVADQFSVRPGVVTNFNFDDGGTAIYAPVTYDFAPITPDGRLLPYVGGGVALVTGGGTSIGPMATAGVDYLLTDNLVLNGGVNVNFTGTTRVGGVVGLGITF